MTAPMCAISLLLLTVGGGAAWYIHRLQRNVSELLAQNVGSVRAAEELEIRIRELRARLNYYVLTQDPEHLAELAPMRREIGHWLEGVEQLATTREEMELVGQLRKAHDELTVRLDRILARAPGEDSIAEADRVVDDLLSSTILPRAHEYLTFHEDVVVSASQRNRVLSDRMVAGLVLLGACGAAAGLLGGAALSRRLHASIVQLSLPVRDAAGKLEEVVGPISFSSGEGLPELEETMKQVAGTIGSVIERLHLSQRRALQGEQLAAVGQLAAGMAHELRNPLMAMKILVQAAARGHSPGLGQRDLQVLEEEILRMERVIQDFLDFARPPRLEKQQAEVRGIVEQTVSLISRRAHLQGVEIETEMPREPVLAEVDVGQLRQVLLNLLINALEAIPCEGRVWLGLEVEEGGPDEGSWLVITVEDNGCGLPENVVGRIFDPFFTNKETGTGLGLPTCKQIVEAHGGTIVGTDRPEGGATFVCRLPLRVAGAPRSPAA